MLMFAFFFCAFNALIDAFDELFDCEFNTNKLYLIIGEVVFVDNFEIRERLIDVVPWSKNNVTVFFKGFLKVFNFNVDFFVKGFG